MDLLRSRPRQTKVVGDAPVRQHRATATRKDRRRLGAGLVAAPGLRLVDAEMRALPPSGSEAPLDLSNAQTGGECCLLVTTPSRRAARSARSLRTIGTACRELVRPSGGCPQGFGKSGLGELEPSPQRGGVRLPLGHTADMRFETTMAQTGNNTGIPVPEDVVAALGGGKRAAVSVTVNGYAYRSTIASMGGQYLIPFSSDKRKETGIAGGDLIVVDLELDTAPRTIEPPADFAAALDEAGLRAAFDALAPSHRKAHVTAIEETKSAATRERRIAAAVAKIGA